MFYRIEVRAFWWPLQYLDFLVLKPFSHDFGSMLGVIVHLDDPFAYQALTSWLMSWDVASIYPHTFPSSWCHLFCEVHETLLQQSTPTTWCCHPHASRLGLCSLACKPPPYSSKHNDIIMAKQFYFCFIRPKVRSLSPCAVANRSLAVLWWFWSSGVFLAERPFGFVYIGLVLLWI